MQTAIDLGEPRQNPMSYPMPFAEKYCPRRVEDFVGLDGPKKFFLNRLAAPRPEAILLVGPPGTGKTTMTMAFTEQLPGTLIHIAAQRCDAATLDKIGERLLYYPGTGKFWVVLVDEADRATEGAQLQFLSKLDGTAALRPKFGGGFERGVLPPVFWVFTSNGRGEEGTDVARMFEPRFLSRCKVLPCTKPEVPDIHKFLLRIWELEGGEPGADLLPLAEGCDGVRDALSKLEVALCTGMLPKRPKPIQAATAPQVHSRVPGHPAECRGRICYVSPGGQDPDPREWEFRKITKKNSRMFFRRSNQEVN